MLGAIDKSIFKGNCNTAIKSGPEVVWSRVVWVKDYFWQGLLVIARVIVSAKFASS